MRTEYKLYRRVAPSVTYKADPDLYSTAADAAATTDSPGLARWTARPIGDGWHTDSPAGGVEYLITVEQVAENDAERVQLALDVALSYGQDDGAHHKAWVIDQMVRILAADRYAQIVAGYRAGEDGPDTYEWDEGIAP